MSEDLATQFRRSTGLLRRTVAEMTGANSDASRAAGRVLVGSIRRVLGVRGTAATPSAPGEPPHRVTGRLQRSIRQAVVNGVRRVGTGDYTARWEEFGVASPKHTQAPRPFMRPGFLQAKDQMTGVIVGDLRAKTPRLAR